MFAKSGSKVLSFVPVIELRIGDGGEGVRRV